MQIRIDKPKQFTHAPEVATMAVFACTATFARLMRRSAAGSRRRAFSVLRMQAKGVRPRSGAESKSSCAVPLSPFFRGGLPIENVQPKREFPLDYHGHWTGQPLFQERLRYLRQRDMQQRQGRTHADALQSHTGRRKHKSGFMSQASFSLGWLYG